MRALIKNCLRIAGLSIVIGVGLIIAGFSMDTSIFDHWENFNISIPGLSGESFDNAWDDWEEEDNVAGEPRENGKYDPVIAEDQVEDDLYNYSESYDEVKSISLDIDYGTVKIKEGDKFALQAKNLQKNQFKSKMEDGIWKIKDTNSEDRDSKYEISILGIKFTSTGAYDSKRKPVIELTVPKDYVFDNLEIKLNAGIIKAETLKAENVYLDVDSGKLSIMDLTAGNKSTYTVGAGELEIDRIEAKNVTMDCGIGHLTASGTIKGDNSITCGIGAVDLALKGDEKDYNYSVDCGIGTVIINDNRYSGVNRKVRKNSGAGQNFNLDCGIGEITLKMED